MLEREHEAADTFALQRERNLEDKRARIAEVPFGHSKYLCSAHSLRCTQDTQRD